MVELKKVYAVYAIRQTNDGEEKYAVKEYDNLNEADEMFLDYVADFVKGVVKARNRKVSLKVGSSFIVSSPKYGFEIEPDNGIVLEDVKYNLVVAYVYVNDDYTLETNKGIERFVKDLESKFSK